MTLFTVKIKDIIKKSLVLVVLSFLSGCSERQDGVLSSLVMGGALLAMIIISSLIHFVIDAFKSEGFNNKKKKIKSDSLAEHFRSARKIEEKEAMKPWNPETMNYQIWADRRATVENRKKTRNAIKRTRKSIKKIYKTK
tara:strand:+ start:72 stop:488 length:417 start_codon:yes stop_codon:yes gene_type:complete